MQLEHFVAFSLYHSSSLFDLNFLRLKSTTVVAPFFILKYGSDLKSHFSFNELSPLQSCYKVQVSWQYIPVQIIANFSYVTIKWGNIGQRW